MSYVFSAATDETVAFTGALATNAVATYDLALTPALAGVGGSAKNLVRGITIISVQNLAWEIQLRTSATNVSNDPNTDVFLGRWSFAATDAVQNAGAGDWLYYVDGLAVPYRDDDHAGKLHLVLVNRSAAGKNAGATGYLVVRTHLEPMVTP